jgi:hypothetical protein
MSFGMTEALVKSRMEELRGQAARSRRVRSARSGRVRSESRSSRGPLPRLRERLGLVLVEAGLSLLSSSRTRSRVGADAGTYP